MKHQLTLWFVLNNRALNFSAQLCNEDIAPRNHCVRCGRCTDYRNRHCEVVYFNDMRQAYIYQYIYNLLHFGSCVLGIYNVLKFVQTGNQKINILQRFTGTILFLGLQ